MEQEIQNLREELESVKRQLNFFILIDRYQFQRDIEILDGRNFRFKGNIGTKFGKSVSEKLGFWNVTPVIQPTNAAQAAVATTAATQTNPYGYSTQAQADGIITLLNRIRTDLVALGLIKGS